MHDAAHLAFPAPAQNVGEIVERVALMKDDRHPRFERDVELRPQHLGLHVARTEIVVIVEARLADRDDVVFVQNREQLGGEAARSVARFVRMHAGGDAQIVRSARFRRRAGCRRDLRRR